MALSPNSTQPLTPPDFATVFGRLRPHLRELDRFLRQQVAEFEPEIRDMADYCIDTSGKRIRPALVFLSGWQGEGRVSPDLVKVAAVVELVHMATLVHDDIMDEADLRRLRKTATRAFGPEAAVLLGDALFAHALHLASQFPTAEVCAAVSESTRRVCAGEIVQTLRRGTIEISRADYYRVIDLKTAELFRVSCALGSKLGLGDPALVAAMATYGRQLGIAYQIYDDLADFFGTEAAIGKTLGTDLESGKVTLPLLHLLGRLPSAEVAELEAEITRKRPPDLPRRVAQMREYGIFSSVEEELETCLAEGEKAVRDWRETPAVPLLLSLGSALREQVAKLRPI